MEFFVYVFLHSTNNKFIASFPPKQYFLFYI